MKSRRNVTLVAMASVLFTAFLAFGFQSIVFAGLFDQVTDRFGKKSEAPASPQGEPLAQIYIYKGEVAGTGVGINGFTLAVGEEMTFTAKGVDKNGKDVPIWPTWKCDRELQIRVVEGRSKTVVVKGIKEGAPTFFSCIYITDDGKRVEGQAMGKVVRK